MPLDLPPSHPEYRPAAEVRRFVPDTEPRESFQPEARAAAINESTPQPGQISRPQQSRNFPQNQPNLYADHPHSTLQRRTTFPDNRRRKNEDLSKGAERESAGTRESGQPLTIIRQVAAEVFDALRHAAKYIKSPQDPRLKEKVKAALRQSLEAKKAHEAQTADLASARAAWEYEYPLLAPVISQFEEGVDYKVYQTSGEAVLLPEGTQKLQTVEKFIERDDVLREVEIGRALKAFVALKSKESPESFAAKIQRLVPRLQNGRDYKIVRNSTERNGAVLTQEGISYMQAMLGVDNFDADDSIEDALNLHLGFESENQPEEKLERNWPAIIAQAVTHLSATDDYLADKAKGTVNITSKGMNRVEALIGPVALYSQDLSVTISRLNRALAEHIFKGYKEISCEQEAAKFVAVVARLKLDGTDCIVDAKNRKVKLTEAGRARAIKLLRWYENLDDETIKAIEGKLAENLFGPREIQPVVQLTEAEKEKLQETQNAEERLARLINRAVREALEKGKADRRTRTKPEYLSEETLRAHSQEVSDAGELAALMEKYPEALKPPANRVDHGAELLLFATRNHRAPEALRKGEELAAQRALRRREIIRSRNNLRQPGGVDYEAEY